MHVIAMSTKRQEELWQGCQRGAWTICALRGEQLQHSRQRPRSRRRRFESLCTHTYSCIYTQKKRAISSHACTAPSAAGANLTLSSTVQVQLFESEQGCALVRQFLEVTYLPLLFFWYIKKFLRRILLISSSNSWLRWSRWALQPRHPPPTCKPWSLRSTNANREKLVFSLSSVTFFCL